MRTMKRNLAIGWISSTCVIVAALAGIARADVALPAVLSDGMVLQCEQRVPVWGTAAPGEAISVEFNGQKVSETADAQGRWRVDLESMKASATPAKLTVIGRSNQVAVNDVLIGEVWLCSGQSNMVWPLANAKDGPAAVASAKHPRVRLFNVPRRLADGPGRDVNAKWMACTPETAHSFSAVGYYFGLKLHEDLDVPVGLLFSAWGGTPAEAWTARASFGDLPELKPIIERTDAAVAERPRAQEDYNKALEDWRETRRIARSQGKPLPRQPRVPLVLARQRDAGALYDSMIAPLIPFAIRGATWYQGEANASRAEQYRVLLAEMIKGWRSQWAQAEPGGRDFPFGIVQLPNYRPQSEQPDDTDWSHLREAQRRVAAEVPNVALIVTIDAGAGNDLHPPDKRIVGERLARWAMADVYRRGGEWSGPAFKSAKFEGTHVKVTFDHVGESGLQLRGGGDAPHEFTVAGEDHVWHRAEAKISGLAEVEVWSEKVLTPKAVRYAWDANPKDPNLTNATGLPAGPFRTDDWPGPTDGKR
jgi:sialate O-acetylesterase